MKITNHMNTKILRGNLVTGKKTTEVFTNLIFPLPGLKTGWGNQPLAIYLWRSKTPLVTVLLSGTNREGHQALKPTE